MKHLAAIVFVSACILGALEVKRLVGQTTTNPPPLPVQNGPVLPHSSEHTNKAVNTVIGTVLLRTQTNWIGGPSRKLGTIETVLGSVSIYEQNGMVVTGHVVEVTFAGKNRELVIGDWGRLGSVSRDFRLEGTNMIILSGNLSHYATNRLLLTQ